MEFELKCKSGLISFCKVSHYYSFTTKKNPWVEVVPQRNEWISVGRTGPIFLTFILTLFLSLSLSLPSSLLILPSWCFHVGFHLRTLPELSCRTKNHPPHPSGSSTLLPLKPCVALGVYLSLRASGVSKMSVIIVRQWLWVLVGFGWVSICNALQSRAGIQQVLY